MELKAAPDHWMRWTFPDRTTVSLRLKIEIDPRELSLFPCTCRPGTQWTTVAFAEPLQFARTRLEAPVGTMLWALYQSKKGRDLFELGVAQEVESLNTAVRVACFAQ